jgi:phytoene desaturase
VIVHVENAFGVFSVKGGIFALSRALETLARELGVEIATGVDIEEILTERSGGLLGGSDRAVGVRYQGGQARADLVVANCDVAHLYERLLPRSREAAKLATKYAGEELSLSAYVYLALAKRPPLDLLHHNVFFSSDYKREFDELIGQGRAPSAPTVYLNAQDRVDQKTLPSEPERCFFLSNAPPRRAGRTPIDWEREAPLAKERIVRELARHGWKLEATTDADIRPTDLEQLFPSSRGSIYGLASNSKMAAFKRPSNKVPGVERLYAVGGTVHPGAGLPMVALSAKIAVELALADA